MRNENDDIVKDLEQKYKNSLYHQTVKNAEMLDTSNLFAKTVPIELKQMVVENGKAAYEAMVQLRTYLENLKQKHGGDVDKAAFLGNQINHINLNLMAVDNLHQMQKTPAINKQVQVYAKLIDNCNEFIKDFDSDLKSLVNSKPAPEPAEKNFFASLKNAFSNFVNFFKNILTSSSQHDMEARNEQQPLLKKAIVVPARDNLLNVVQEGQKAVKDLNEAENEAKQNYRP